MCNNLYNAMMSYARESMDSVRFYRELSWRRHTRSDYYRREAWRALKRARYYREWAAEEKALPFYSERSRTWEEVNVQP